MGSQRDAKNAAKMKILIDSHYGQSCLQKVVRVDGSRVFLKLIVIINCCEIIFAKIHESSNSPRPIGIGEFDDK